MKSVIAGNLYEQKLLNDLRQVFDDLMIDYNNLYNFCTTYLQNIAYVKAGDFVTITFILIISKTQCDKPIGFLQERFCYGMQNGLLKGYFMQGTENEQVTDSVVFRALSCGWSGELSEIIGSINDPIERINIINEEEVEK